MAADLINKIFLGEVASVHNYGAFVKLPVDGRTHGLVHKSQISKVRVHDATEVLQQHEKVWFKVISVNDDNKLSLSMKVVDQGNGRDLDPNGVQMSFDALKKKDRVGRGENPPISLEAILNTKCSKCGITGHMSNSCFQVPGGKVYELIPEPETEKKIFGSVTDRLQRLAGSGITTDADSVDKVTGDKNTERKSRKHKRKKKHRKHSSSSDSDLEIETKKKRGKKSSHRKRYSSLSSNESEVSPPKGHMAKKRDREWASTRDVAIKERRNSTGSNPVELVIKVVSEREGGRKTAMEASESDSQDSRRKKQNKSHGQTSSSCEDKKASSSSYKNDRKHKQ